MFRRSSINKQRWFQQRAGRTSCRRFAARLSQQQVAAGRLVDLGICGVHLAAACTGNGYFARVLRTLESKQNSATPTQIRMKVTRLC